MSSNNPLPDDGLKVVLQYLDANLRYHLASCIPSIRVVEQLVPLRFDRVSFDTNTTRVNKTTYHVGIYREYPDGYDVPKHHHKINEAGGEHYDQNEDGFDIHDVKQVLTPGDVNIRYGRNPPTEYVNDGQQALYERHLEIYETALAMRLSAPVEDFLDDNGTPPLEIDELGDAGLPEAEVDRLEQELLDRIGNYSGKKLKDCVRYFRTCLVPYYCRQNNTPLPYTRWIQLTIGGKQVYRHPHNIELQRAMKKVNTVLFGDRECIHQTQVFSVKRKNMMIKLPKGFRVKIRDLFVTGNVQLTCTALEKIVEESSYPLRSLTIVDDVLNSTHYNNDIVKKATVLNIKPRNDLTRSCLRLLLSLNNQTVNLKCASGRFTVEKQYRLMAHWIDNWKAVGTSLSYETIGNRNVESLLQQITLRLIGSRLNNRVLMPINNGTSLEVQCVRIRNQNEEHRWKVQMRVVAGQDEQDEQVVAPRQ